jgi:hypothetical protein
MASPASSPNRSTWNASSVPSAVSPKPELHHLSRRDFTSLPRRATRLPRRGSNHAQCRSAVFQRRADFLVRCLHAKESGFSNPLLGGKGGQECPLSVGDTCETPTHSTAKSWCPRFRRIAVTIWTEHVYCHENVLRTVAFR